MRTHPSRDSVGTLQGDGASRAVPGDEGGTDWVAAGLGKL